MTIRKEDEEITQRRIPAGVWIVLILVLAGGAFIALAPESARELWKKIGILGQSLDPLATVLTIASFLVLIIQPVWRLLTGKLESRGVKERTVVGKAMDWLTRFIDWLARYPSIALVVFVISLIFYTLIATAPLFKIINPNDGATIISTSGGITVEGTGAEASGMVVVYVFDGSKPYPQRGPDHIDQRGNWSVDNVILQTENFTYVIWAETILDGQSVITINRPRVTRTTSANPYGAIIGGAIVVILLVISGVIWVIRKGKGR